MFGKASGISWIVAFLGNPGSKYSGTRHNAGFLAADELAKGLGVGVNRLRFRSLTGQARIGGEQVLLMKPQTYMNLSGEAVGAAARFYKIPADHILVVSDEIALPPGRIRIRQKGSAGGHNGLKNIIAHLGTDQFPRVRIGVGSPPQPGPDQIDWVLGVPKNEDAVAYADAIRRAAEAVKDYIENGPEHAMSRYN